MRAHGPRPALYRVDDETGAYILNSRIAHIHARRQGGPRWIDMPPENNRAFDNQVLLCIEHSYEVDERAGAFPADTMRAWKRAQRDEYEQFQRSWPITDEQAAQVLDASEASGTL